MVEYGGGISHGPAGQVSGSTHPFGSGNVDLGASIGNFVDGAAHTISTMPPGMLAVAVVIVVLGLILLRRAF
jgi:hypothetical protein